MADDVSDIPGTERAAILLLTLGEDEASRVLKHLDAREVDAVSATMARLGNVPLALTEKNARKICEPAGRPDIRVFAGAGRPLVRIASAKSACSMASKLASISGKSML